MRPQPARAGGDDDAPDTAAPALQADAEQQAAQLAQWLASQEFAWREVVFPSGRSVRACPLPLRTANAAWRQYGLYADARWTPDWPATVLDWPDFGLPRDADTTAQAIVTTWQLICSGQQVEVGCLGALGRTGVLLACLAILDGVPAADAVAWVRRTYRAEAVETAAQEQWVRWFADWLTGSDDPPPIPAP